MEHTHKYVITAKEKLEQAYEEYRQQQMHTQHSDREEKLLFATGDRVWLENRRRRKGSNHKLQPKFMGPYHLRETYSNYTYLLEQQ